MNPSSGYVCRQDFRTGAGSGLVDPGPRFIFISHTCGIQCGVMHTNAKEGGIIHREAQDNSGPCLAATPAHPSFRPIKSWVEPLQHMGGKQGLVIWETHPRTCKRCLWGPWLRILRAE